MTKGLYTYESGRHEGQAFWGAGGTVTEETRPLRPNAKHKVRIAELEPSQLAAMKKRFQRTQQPGRRQPRRHPSRSVSIDASTTGARRDASLALHDKATPHEMSRLKHHMSESDLVTQTRDLDGASVADHTLLHLPPGGKSNSTVTANPLAARRSESSRTEISPHLPEGPPRRGARRTPRRERERARGSGEAARVTPQMKRSARASKDSERAKVSAQKRASRRAKAEALLARRKARATRARA